MGGEITIDRVAGFIDQGFSAAICKPFAPEKLFKIIKRELG